MACLIVRKRETSPISNAHVSAVIGPTPAIVRSLLIRSASIGRAEENCGPRGLIRKPNSVGIVVVRACGARQCQAQQAAHSRGEHRGEGCSGRACGPLVQRQGMGRPVLRARISETTVLYFLALSAFARSALGSRLKSAFRKSSASGNAMCRSFVRCN
jgi:hypothetical protein